MLKLLKTYSFALIIPIVIITLAFFLKSAGGPLWQYCDPSYIYYFNALHMLKGITPTLIQHPGIPLQLIILITIWIFNIGLSTPDIIHRALVHPEFYFQAVHFLLILGTFVTYVLLAVYIYHKTSNRWAALLTQLPGLCALIIKSNASNLPILPISANVNPELLLISIVNLFTLCFLALYFAKDSSSQIKWILIMGLVCGLGLSTRLIFFTFLISALIVTPGRKKLILMTVSFVSFFICTLPILSKYPLVWQWAQSIVTHTGALGSGTTGVVDWNTFASHLFKDIFPQHWFFVLITLGAFILSSIQFIKDRTNKNALFLWAACIGTLLHFGIIAKHFSWHYLVLGICSTSPILFLLSINRLFQTQLANKLVMSFVPLFMIVTTTQAVMYHHNLSNLTNDTMGLHDRIYSQYPNCTVIASNSNLVSLYLNQEYALLFGNRYALHHENEELKKASPHAYYFNPDKIIQDQYDGYGIWDSQQRVYGEDLLANYPCVIFLSNTDIEQSAYTLKKIDQSSFANAYLLTGSTEKQANELLSLAEAALQKGDFQQAFALALKSRDLKYEPRGKVEYLLAFIYNKIPK